MIEELIGVYDESTQRNLSIFSPELLKNYVGVSKEGMSLAYYTTAETALLILSNQEIWLRNASVMNDFSEIKYGIYLIKRAFNEASGEAFMEALKRVSPEIMAEVNKLFVSWNSDWQWETYIACVSLHKKSENKIGRLSMWRAYGDVAFVLNKKPFLINSEHLGLNGVPVNYITYEQYSKQLQAVTDSVNDNIDYLKSLSADNVVDMVHEMLFTTAIGTKHPGFEEEQEFRVFYRPSEQEGSYLTPRQVAIKGVPQTIYSLSLKPELNNKPNSLKISNILETIIIGPSDFPNSTRSAFEAVLSAQDIHDPASKITISEIPLRTTS